LEINPVLLTGLQTEILYRRIKAYQGDPCSFPFLGSFRLEIRKKEEKNPEFTPSTEIPIWTENQG
jgi:hypothetical protein